jgi:chemotaxis protein MotB
MEPAGGGGSRLPVHRVNRKKGPACRGVVVDFAEDSAELDPSGRQQVETFLPSILGKPHRLEIRGHSSGRHLPPDSGFRDAWELCYARCLAVMSYLVSRGVEPKRLRLSQGGEFEPVNRERGSAHQAQNSRVEVTILTEWIDGFGEIRNEQGQPPESPQPPLAEETLPVLKTLDSPDDSTQ